ncbi:hypothetical protein [Nonomuraea cavernae]|uniref:hypothetical protein n=1 Tax=Nonomuraea cavernae TaxID=2045107 RepID=UPI00166C16A1|nr:hypothetical protein [Nonomuraea cavernae]MCA2189902.1 hypothetical protein [Nonomuraea cavernae]
MLEEDFARLEAHGQRQEMLTAVDRSSELPQAVHVQVGFHSLGGGVADHRDASSAGVAGVERFLHARHGHGRRGRCGLDLAQEFGGFGADVRKV